MSEKTKKIIYLVYGILQSVLLLICAGCLIYAALSIYDGGEGSYSRETVTSALKSIAIPLILCAVGIVVGAVLSLALPRESQKLRGEMYPSAAIRRMSTRVDQEKCPESLKILIKKEHIFRPICMVVAAVVCVALAVPCCIYLFDLSHFDDIGEGLTEDIVAAMFYVIPAAVLGLLAVGVATFSCYGSLKRELTFTKYAVKKSPKKGKPFSEEVKKERRGLTLWLIRGGVLLVAVVFIVLGVLNDGMNDVLQKAIRICTECIGLG